MPTSSMAENTVAAKMADIRQTLESIHSQSNSLLLFSLQWKDLEDYFTSVSDAIVVRTEEMELKSKKIEWRRKYVARKEAEIELKEERLEDELGRLRNYKLRLKRRFEKREMKLQERELRIDEFNARKEKLGFVERELLQRLEEVELKEKRFDEKVSEAKRDECGSIRVCNDVMVKIEPLDECDGDGILVDPSYADIKINVTMDGRALQMFLNGRVNEHQALRYEVVGGLKLSSDPAKLVLDAIVGFYPEELENGEVCFDLNVVRKSCILLLEVLVKMKPQVKIRVRERAMRVAMEWKGKMNVGDDDHYLEVVGFLWLVATYGLTYEFDKDELMRLFESCLCHSPAPELCRSLGLTDKIHAVIQNLVSRDQPFEAMRLIYAFELVDMFPPVPMLKAHLASRIAHAEQLYKGDPSIEAEINCKTVKLAALVSVVKCIKEYGLESNYQVQPLEDQISELTMQNKYKAQIHTSMAHENTANAGPLTPTISDAPSKDPNCFNPFLSSTMITPKSVTTEPDSKVGPSSTPNLLPQKKTKQKKRPRSTPPVATSGRVLEPHNPLPSSTLITPKSVTTEHDTSKVVSSSNPKILPQIKTKQKKRPRLAPPVVTSGRVLVPHNPLPSSTLIIPKSVTTELDTSKVGPSSTPKILPHKKTIQKKCPWLAPHVVTSGRVFEPHNPHFLPYASTYPHLPPSRPTYMFPRTAHNGGYFVKRYQPYS